MRLFKAAAVVLFVAVFTVLFAVEADTAPVRNATPSMCSTEDDPALATTDNLKYTKCNSSGQPEMAVVVQESAFTKETTAAVVGTAAQVVASKNVGLWPNCAVYVRNKDAAQSLTGVYLYTSPDGEGACGGDNWVNLSWTSCSTLGPGKTCVYSYSALSYTYLCATAKAAAAPGDVDSVETWVHCSAG